jgi:hypothetical protein
MTVIIVMYAPVDERIGHWNMSKSDIQKLSVLLKKNNEVVNYYKL